MALTSIEPSHLAISVAFAGTVVSVVLRVYNYILYPLFWSPLAKIPAARWHSRIVPFYSWYIKYTNVENREVHKLHTKLGPVFVLGPNELSVNSADGLRTVYNGDLFVKTEWYFDRFSNFGYVTIPLPSLSKKISPDGSERRAESTTSSQPATRNTTSSARDSSPRPTPRPPSTPPRLFPGPPPT